MKKIENIKYYKDKELDIYLPDKKDFNTLIYFHGGGIVEGDKTDNNKNFIDLANKGICVVSVNYSLYPKTKFPKFLIEAANSIKYVFKNNKKLGGNGNIFVSGSSAGAYISLMLCFDTHYLLDLGINPLNIKGWYIDSAQTSTHFHVIEYEDKEKWFTQKIDYRGPLYFVNDKLKFSNILLAYYSKDMHLRDEQNNILYKTIKMFNKNAKIKLLKLKGKHCSDINTFLKNGLSVYSNIIIKYISKF